jgi:hypothetical protein
MDYPVSWSGSQKTTLIKGVKMFPSPLRFMGGGHEYKDAEIYIPKDNIKSQTKINKKVLQLLLFLW